MSKNTYNESHGGTVVLIIVGLHVLATVLLKLGII
jgi:hypothetical protein